MDINDNLVDFVVTARKYKTLLTKKYENRPIWKKHQPGEIMSGLPGTIIDICVDKGQRVKEGELLLIAESMKMMNKIISPVSGTIRDIYVNKGDKIGKNHLMIKIDPK